MIAYKITNKLNGKSYIGITTKSLEKRWKEHCNPSNRKGVLPNAIRKYGKDAFVVEQIGSGFLTTDNLLKFESQLISQHGTFKPNGYNVTKGGEGTFGYKWTEDQCQRRKGNNAKEKHYVFQKGYMVTGEKNSNFKGVVVATNKTTNTKIFLTGIEQIKNAGFSPANVSHCLSGKRQSHKGFQFARLPKLNLTLEIKL